jgi:[ribosomal protein S5]-alanine N-acetyltransferase
MADGAAPLSDRLKASNGLVGARTRVRLFAPGDIDAAYLGWLNDPDVVRYSNQRFVHHSAQSAAAFLSGFAGSENLFLSIRRLEDDRAVGTMTVYRAVPHGTADLGILVGDKQVWGQGFGSEAWLLVLDWLQSQRVVRKLTCGTAEPNRAMRRLAELSGMELEATKRRHEIIDGVPVDLLFFSRFAAR